MSLPTHLQEKIKFYSGCDYRENKEYYAFLRGAESLWKILTEMSAEEERAIESESLAALTLDGPAVKRDIFNQGARFGLSMGRVKAEKWESEFKARLELINILKYTIKGNTEERLELESKLAIAKEALKFYALKEHNVWSQMDDDPPESAVLLDGGDKAKEALASIRAQF